MNITIRKGVKSDLPRIMELVRELAVHEKSLDQVTNTVEAMERDGFGDPPAFGSFVAEEGGRVVGIAIYCTKYSSWKGRCIFLEDLIVTESHRRCGIGEALFKRVALLSKETGAQRMEWQVLDWNKSAIDFYKKLGAVLDPEWITAKLTRQQLEQFGD